MDSHHVHVHGDDHEQHAPLQTFCHDVSHALGVAMGRYLRASQITRRRHVHDHGMDDHIAHDHVDDHEIDHEVHHEDVHGSEVPHDDEDVQEFPRSCSQWPLRPRALLFGTDDGSTEGNTVPEPLDPEPHVIDIGRTCVDHHEHEHESFDPLSPGIPRARRSPRVTRSHARVRSVELRDDDIVMVPSRFGEFPLVRKLAAYLQEFHPSHWDVPPHIPIGVEVKVWDRDWIVKDSSLHPSIGLGLFACEDILLPTFPTDKDKVYLFPYCGMVYQPGVWNALSHASPSFRVFALSPDSYPDPHTGRRVTRPVDGYRMIDGDPVRCSNIAAYINSVSIPRALKGSIQRMVPNVEFVFCDGPPVGAPSPRRSRPGAPPQPPLYDFHMMVCATRSIRTGDELFARYDIPTKM